jgi:catechol 2,3-dioxygenase-like lactoylglutathione lyase family enzyme
MLGNEPVYATIAVKDINKAKEFYGRTLGLEQVDENPGGVMYKSGGGKVFVYPSQEAGTNRATYAAWETSDVEAAVNELKAKGVLFEQYDDLPEVTREGDIHVMGDMKAAWFKDPDGNILSIGSS